MSLSRRDFLEVSALSATGLMLGNLATPQPAYGEAQNPEDTSGPGFPPHASTARLELSFDHDWQFFRPTQDKANVDPSFAAGTSAIFPPNTEWEAATLPHS